MFSRKSASRAVLAIALFVAPASLALADAPLLVAAPVGPDTPPGVRPVDKNMQALCQTVDVDADEGYGVRGRETRSVCGDAN